jgi:outer membrane protein assembly factor BamD (BamD/ComL family)
MTINEEPMRQVEKKYRGTKWADLAAFHLLENKLCGDWAAQSKCPEKEAEVYDKYVQDHPNSPAAPEALYNAAYRYAALIEIYKVEGNASKAPGAAQRAVATAQKISGKNPNENWGTRAQRLIYMVQNNIPVYGSNLE